ncbi:hypothetical protein Q2T70_06975 [Klebsiella oxytoca]|uniref:hypothetical protein n=1 Tax=Klebsiella oxytoca TaxID=571 RepID=UPI00265F4F15|nr:hypothetical protein [Klebsiella oxytoca]WKM73462.1 hypothetical protein Q2T70_06975 [Klebsiella oxytoca]
MRERLKAFLLRYPLGHLVYGAAEKLNTPRIESQTVGHYIVVTVRLMEQGSIRRRLAARRIGGGFFGMLLQ